jgi:hypothetical protein
MAKKLSVSERKMARKSLGEERLAVKDYTARKAKTKNPRLRKAFSHAIPEEKTHRELFLAALKQR